MRTCTRVRENICLRIVKKNNYCNNKKKKFENAIYCPIVFAFFSGKDSRSQTVDVVPENHAQIVANRPEPRRRTFS